MKILREVNKKEVKRDFVISQYIRKHNIGKHRYLPKLSREEFIKKLELAKSHVLKLSESKLDRLIKEEYTKRWKAYNAVFWYEGIVNTDEVGVWKAAGGLPKEWTEKSLAVTAKKVSDALEKNDPGLAARAKRAIPRMLQTLDLIESDKYLYPIILPGGTMGRKGLQIMKGDIDDGCMRSIALACSGRKQIKAYIGLQNKFELD